MSLSKEEKEVLEEIKKILGGLYVFRYPDAADGLRMLADAIDQEEHDIDKIGVEVQNIFGSIKSKGEITQEEIQKLEELAQDTRDFQKHLEETRYLLERGGEVNQAFEIIDSFDDIEEALDALETLESKLEKIEKQ